MKKTSKILLSALAVSSMFFTMTVNAEELTPSENQEPVQVTRMGAETFDAITKEKFDSIVPNTIEITKTKTEFSNAVVKDNGSLNEDLTKIIEEINTEIETEIISLFENSGYMDTEEIEKEAIKAQFNDPFYDLYSVTVSLNIDGKTKYSKDITIKYAKESNYSATDETYVKNAVNSIKFAKYGNSDWGIEESDAVFTMYNIGDEESTKNWGYENYDFNTLINDNSITIKTSVFAGGFGGGTPWGTPVLLHFYKNGVLYETKSIWYLGAYGITLENGTPVNMARLEQDDEIYKAMAKELESKGFTNVLGCYELTAYGTTYDNMRVSFNLGTNYNGKEVQILHKKKDNTYEIFKTTVADGKAEITVNEFSPFMIALTENTTTENVNKAPNNAQTSSMNIVLYSILALGSLVGITYILVSNKKKEIA